MNKKNVFLTIAMILGLISSVIFLSAFSNPKQNSNKKIQTEVSNDDDWRLFRRDVDICDGDNGTCLGRGNVWVNLDTEQVEIRLRGGECNCGNANGCHFDVTQYLGKEGYNYRFWHTYLEKYCYLYINIPQSYFGY